MKCHVHVKAYSLIALLAAGLMVTALLDTDAQEGPDSGIAAAKETINDIRSKLDQLEQLVDGLGRGRPAEASRPAAAAGPRAAPTVQATPIPAADARVTWVKNIEWHPNGGIEAVPQASDSPLIVLNGSCGGSGCVSSPGAVEPNETHNVLVVKVMDLGQSKFNCAERMLKVTIGQNDKTLRSTRRQSPGDKDFVLQGIGDFFYVIPKEFFSGPQKLVLAFWQADVKGLQLQVGLTTEQLLPPSQGQATPGNTATQQPVR